MKVVCIEEPLHGNLEVGELYEVKKNEPSDIDRNIPEIYFLMHRPNVGYNAKYFKKVE